MNEFFLLVSWFPHSINQHQHRRCLRRLHHLLKRFILHIRLLEFCRHVRHGFQEAQEQTALHRVIHLVAVRKDSGSDRVAVRQHLGRDDAHHVAARVHQRTVPVWPIARLHRQADLGITRAG